MNTETLLGIGRVVYINYGPLAGKIAVVVDIINENRVIIDGPGLGVSRQTISVKRLTLTKFLLGDYKFGDSEGELQKKINSFDLVKRYTSCGMGKKIAKQERRRALTDFERFKVLVLRRKLSRTVRTSINKNRKSLVAK
jgi:large subunit ribosomal protein L14e